MQSWLDPDCADYFPLLGNIAQGEHVFKQLD